MEGLPFSTHDFGQHFGEIQIKPRSARVRLSVCEPPPASFLKFNVDDGSSKENPGPNGVGGVVRNHGKEFVGLFSLHVGFAWAYEAKSEL